MLPNKKDEIALLRGVFKGGHTVENALQMPVAYKTK